MKQIFFGSILFSLIILIVIQGHSEAADESVELKGIVITATRTEIPIEQTASSITVIDSKMIEDKKIRTVYDALRLVPGLNVIQTGGPGGTTSFFLRGTNSNHALVLIDGIEVNSATDGAYNSTDLTTDNIERIEILRGPQSTLYGSNAVGGVIHIITKRGKDGFNPSASLEFGSYDTLRWATELSGANEGLDYSLSASKISTDGFSKANESNGNTEDDGYKNTTVSSRIGVIQSSGSRIEWTARYTSAEVDQDDCGLTCPVDDLNFVQETVSRITALRFSKEVKAGWDQELTFSFNDETLKGSDPDLDDQFNNFKIKTIGKRIEWQNNIRFSQNYNITVGYEYEALRGENEDSFEKSAINNGLYAFYQEQQKNLVFNAGLRYDDNNRFGKETTYKVEAAYFMRASGGKLRGGYGTAFHGPTFNDLYFPGFGNPDLDPEKSQSWEIGLDQPLFNRIAHISGTYFETDIDDLIVFVVTDPVTFEGLSENVEKATIRGLEISGDFALGHFMTLSGNYTWVDTENLETGNQLARRPKRKASATVVMRPINHLNLNADLIRVGRRYNDTANTILMKPYTVINASSTYSLTSSINIFVRVENALDKDYEEVAGYGTAGRSTYGGLKVKF